MGSMGLWDAKRGQNGSAHVLLRKNAGQETTTQTTHVEIYGAYARTMMKHDEACFIHG